MPSPPTYYEFIVPGFSSITPFCGLIDLKENQDGLPLQLAVLPKHVRIEVSR